MLDLNSNGSDGLRGEPKPIVRYNIESLEYERFIPKPVLKTKNRTLFEQQGFPMQRLHRMYPYATFDKPKQTQLLFNLPPPPNGKELN